MRKLIVAAAMAATLLAASPAEAHHAKDWKPCKQEDGSGQARCIWDAKHQGNGVGQSLKIIKGGTDDAKYVKISHRRAKHLLGANHA